MNLILTRKLADFLDGVDVSRLEVGDAMELPTHEADLLIAEGWVVRDRRTARGDAPAVERRRRAGASQPRTLEDHLNTAS